jgi:hypothetical protein
LFRRRIRLRDFDSINEMFAPASSRLFTSTKYSKVFGGDWAARRD